MANNWKSGNFEFEDEVVDRGRHRWTPYIGAGVLVCLLGGVVLAVVRNIGGTAPPQEPFIQQISIVQPPPPPPPPKIEEPEPEIDEIDLDEPEPEMADELADMDELPGEELGLDAEGSAGGDQFGLLAKKGGRGLIGSDPHAWYAGVLQRDLQKVLSGADDVRKGNYTVVVSIWITRDGFVESSELLSGTNDPELDQRLRDALQSGIRISREPPEDLPQPIRVRITSRT